MWGLSRRADEQPVTEPLPIVQPQQEPRTAADAVTVQDIIDRINRENAAAGRDALVIDHAAPRGRITVDQARALAQDHKECPMIGCPAKRRARATLVEHGIIRLAPANNSLAPGRPW